MEVKAIVIYLNQRNTLTRHKFPLRPQKLLTLSLQEVLHFLYFQTYRTGLRYNCISSLQEASSCLLNAYFLLIFPEKHVIILLIDVEVESEDKVSNQSCLWGEFSKSPKNKLSFPILSWDLFCLTSP